MGRLTTRYMVAGASVGMAAVLGLGCARPRVMPGARVENVQGVQQAALPRPGRVVVFDFDTGASDVTVGRSPRRTVRNAVGLYVPEADVLAAAVADGLASKLVDGIKGRGFSVERAAKAAPPQINDLVIQGQFIQIDEGSQAHRFVIGFGVGATELRTHVQVFQVAADGWRPIKQFDTVAEGSRFPGAGFFVAGGAAAGTVATSAMISSGVGVVREVRASIDADARRTAEQISGKLSELSTAQRW